ncbi:MAG TPA: phosphate signaling complex protein PhoU [Candidatus Fournierella merdigallinarum]|nr:phosphate signaling complex protein PhoU [Candidatus Fournierella merdigallinarum]
MQTRNNYTEALGQLRVHVMEMGGGIVQAIGRTQRALEQLDAPLARAVIAGDDEFDRMERDIEQECLTLVVTQSPVAGDWRRIASIMRMIADLERIADHCSDIGEYVEKLAGKQRVEHIPYLAEMFALMQRMVQDTVQAYVDLDVEKARLVIARDDEQDDYFEEVCQELCQRMAQSPGTISQYVDYLMIAKYLERMSDHATNLAQWIEYIVKGELSL